MFSQRLIGPVRTGDMNTKDIDIFDLSATAPVYKKNFAEGGEAKTVDPNVQEVKQILKSAGINKLYQAADSLGIRLPDGIGVDSAADVITNELLLRANIPVRKKDDTFTLDKSLGKGISFRADVNPKQKSGFLNISGRFNEGGIAAKDIDIFDEEPSGVQKISKLISDGQVREAYSEFEELPLTQQLTVSVTPVIGDALAAYEVGEFGTRAKESLSRGSPLGAAGNAALAGLAGLSFIPLLRALRGARPIGKLLKKSEGLESLSNIKDQNKRLLRAADQGFDVDNVFYHGSGQDIQEFRLPTKETGQTRTAGTGIFFSNSPGVASSYSKGPNRVSIYPVYAKTKEFLKIKPEKKGMIFSQLEVDKLNVEFPNGDIKKVSEVFNLDPNSTVTTDQLAKLSRKINQKGLIIKDIVDIGTGTLNRFIEQPSDVLTVFDPTSVRSTLAEFNPNEIKSAGLLKAKGGIVSLLN